MKRDDCGKILRARLSSEALVYCSLGSAGRTWRAQEAPHITYYSSDPMGMALPASLGLALAQPRRQVLFIGGDGDLVMSLGCLLTVVGAAPANLKLMVFDNGRYETGGSQRLAGSGAYSLNGEGLSQPFVSGGRLASKLRRCDSRNSHHAAIPVPLSAETGRIGKSAFTRCASRVTASNENGT